MPNESSSSVWLQPSPQISCDVSASEIVHRLPHLAWFSPSQMARWREKLLGRPPRFTRGNHRHRLAGIIACAYCHATLSRNGKNGYRCANYGRGCDAGLFVTERLAGEAVDRLLPEAISGSEALAEAIRSYLSVVEPKALEGRIEEL